MGESASKTAAQPLSLDELKALWEKHDTNGTGQLERAEVHAVLDDIRKRYGLNEPLPEEFADAVFEDLDADSTGTWSWHDMRQLGGDTYTVLRRRLQRRRLQKGLRHHKAHREKTPTWLDKFTSLVDQASGSSGVAPAKPLPVLKSTEPKEPVILIFHAMRAEGLTKAENAWGFNPCVEVRVVRGHPRRGNNGQFDMAVLEGPYVARGETGTADRKMTDPGWLQSVVVEFMRIKGLYVHIVIFDKRLGVQPEPLADGVFTLDEVLQWQQAPRVQRYKLEPISIEQTCEGVVLVAQWGGERPQLSITCYIVRGEYLPKESLFVEVELYSSGNKCVLAKGRSSVVAGPNPEFQSEVHIEGDNEGDMMLQCTIFRRLYGFTEEPVGELVTALPQAALVPKSQACRYPLRPYEGVNAGAQLTLAFGMPPTIKLVVKPSGATGLAPKEDAWSFDPFVHVYVKSSEPRSGSANVPIIVQGRTETISNCTGDPHWVEPVILKFVAEENLYIHIVVCSERFANAADELADMVITVEEAVKLGTAALERRFFLELRTHNRRHTRPEIFLSFADLGGSVSLGATDNRDWIPEIGTNSIAKASRTANTPVSIGVVGSSVPKSPQVIQIATKKGGKIDGCAQEPSLTCPPLGQVLELHGQTVPVALGATASQFGTMPASLPKMHYGLSQATLQNIATQHGGIVRGPVPLSFINNPTNPHAAWLIPPGV